MADRFIRFSIIKDYQPRTDRTGYKEYFPLNRIFYIDFRNDENHSTIPMEGVVVEFIHAIVGGLKACWWSVLSTPTYST